MNIKLKIDGNDYTSKLREDQEFIIAHQVEDGVNNPVCSTAKFTLHNDFHFENYFTDSVTFYNINKLGYVEIEYDFPSYIIFRGHIDRESLEFDFNDQNVSVTVIGLEKAISGQAARYDITQAFYYKTSEDDYRQRNGRIAAIRHNPDNYTLINDLLESMIEDLGYNYHINIPHSESFKTKYNAEKYGAVSSGLRPIAIARSQTGERGILPQIASGTFVPFPTLDSENGSYNFMLKEFAKITNNIYFYNHRFNKIFFIPRDYANLAEETNYQVINIDEIILDRPIQRVFNPAYGGVFLTFDDISLGVYSDNSSLLIGAQTKFGFNLSNIDTPVINQDSDKNYYLGGFNGSQKRYNLYTNPSKLNKSLYLANALRVNISAPLSDYLVPEFGGDSIEKYMTNIIWDNFYTTLKRIKRQKIEVNAPLFAPLRISYEGQGINVFSTTTNMWEETTLLEFDY